MRRISVWALSLAFVVCAAAVPAQMQEQPRIPYVSDHPDDPDLAKNFDGFRARQGYVSNMVQVTANAPAINKAIGDFAIALRGASKVPKIYTNLTIMRIAQLEGGKYQYLHELPAARGCGISQAQIDALPDWRKNSAFDPQQRAVLAYADGMTEKAGPDDATVKALASFFTPEQIVELTTINGFYVMQARFGNALRVPIEPNFDSGKTNPSC
jgi:alkylhydroperoxidase family enzyme